MTNKSIYRLIFVLLFCGFCMNYFAQSANGFSRSLSNHLIKKEGNFSVEFKGDVESFLNRLNALIEEAKTQAGLKNVFVETMETTTSYSSSRATVSFKVSYLNTPKLFVKTNSELVGVLESEIFKRTKIIEIGVKKFGGEIKTVFNNALESAVKSIEGQEKSVVLISHESSYLIYDSFVIVKLIPEYLSKEKKSTSFCYNQKELTSLINGMLKKRNSRFIIHFLGNVSGTDVDIDKAYKDSYSGDVYLENNITEINFSYSQYSKSRVIEFNIKYLTTRMQEEELETFVKNKLKEIIKPGMNKYEIEKGIHDFIVLSVKYDDKQNNKSAYDAVFRGATQCHGYSLLAQKFFDMAGIESIIVSSPEMDHAWNMVEIGGNWYHLDVTWDDPVPDEQGRVRYNYFNLTDKEMLSHPDRAHSWDRNKYPKASTKFDRQLIRNNIK